MSLTSPSEQPQWWKSATVYQIYPISFFDSNGDGLGDLPGITAKLDYLRDLGADVLWLCPIYRSPLADMGYDISDYRDIDPRYGTLADWDVLLKSVHDRGMKLMMDLVVNHTSDEHEWFRQSRASKHNNPRRDWYIWRPPRYDSEGKRHPPNNWKSVFQGSAWDYDEETDEYYLHLYVSKQPDLNWENPDVRAAVYDVMRFWVDRGCDGFRMDVINLISKVPGLPDAPIVHTGEEYQPAFMYYANGPRVHEFIKEMDSQILSKHDLITVGETPFTHSAAALAAYVLPANHELNMVFQFQLMDIDSSQLEGDHVPLIWRQWRVCELADVVSRWQTYERDAGFWNAVFIENHDQARSVSRFGNDTPTFRVRSAKLLALLQIAQGGTLYVYQGEELGLANFPRSWGVEEYKDVATQNYWNLILEQRREKAGGGDVDMSDVLDGCQRKARDHARTPMQWNASLHGGFTTGTPWMRVNDDYAEWNAAEQVANTQHSVHGFWKRALRLRKERDILIFGDFLDLAPGHEQVFAFRRSLGAETAIVVLNFKETEISVSLEVQSAAPAALELLFGNYDEDEEPGIVKALQVDDGRMTVRLQPYEGRIYIS